MRNEDLSIGCLELLSDSVFRSEREGGILDIGVESSIIEREESIVDFTGEGFRERRKCG